MPRLVIDNQEVEVPPGSSVLDAARRLGIDIPTLCYLEGQTPLTSCMVCVVKVNGRDALVPSCATRAEEGMVVESETDEVREQRRCALELLLSDHLGDCEAPCQTACPAHMDIPRMIRHIAAGQVREALITIKQDIALPATLGRICPAPCEKACRRGQADAPLSICLLKRYAADADLASAEPYVPPRKDATGKRVAIVGAGPAGLAAAYHLLQQGHACTLFDEHDAPGGMLRYGVPEEKLPRDVLDAEIDVIRNLGAEFRMSRRLDSATGLERLRKDFDAVLVATGQDQAGQASALGLKVTRTGIQVDRQTCATSAEGVFAAGGAVRATRMAVRALADGKAAAACIDQHLRNRPVAVPPRPFSTHIGKLLEGEMERFLAGACRAGRTEPAGGPGAGLSDSEARREALRCLHCDCRKADACRLRRYCQLYGARPSRYKGQRKPFRQYLDHPQVIYEPGKCIACGLCIQIAAQASEPLGLTFIGRGFDVRVAAPFDRSIAEALQKAAAECVAACPTGALAFR